jgi:hypothetical protein
MQIQQEPLTDAQSSAIVGINRTLQRSSVLILNRLRFPNLHKKRQVIKVNLQHMYKSKGMKLRLLQDRPLNEGLFLLPKDGLSNEPFLGLIFSDDWIKIERKPYNLRNQ